MTRQKHELLPLFEKVTVLVIIVDEIHISFRGFFPGDDSKGAT